MLIGDFCDLVLSKFSYTNMEAKKADRREIIVQADAIRGELLAAGNYSATKVGESWQFNIGNDLRELPSILFISKSSAVIWDDTRKKYYSILPGEVVTFKNKSGVRIIHGIQTNDAGQGVNINWQTDRTDFIIQQAGAGVAYGLLESAMLAGTVGAEIEMKSGTNGVVYYNNMQPGMWSHVLITYMPRLWGGGLAESDMMPMDDTFAKMLADKVFDSFIPQKQFPRENQ